MQVSNPISMYKKTKIISDLEEKCFIARNNRNQDHDKLKIKIKKKNITPNSII